VPAWSTALDHALGCHDEVDVDVVRSGGDLADRLDLELVDRRHNDRRQLDEPRFRRDRELQVAEPQWVTPECG